jgi:hypothetical protein
MTLMTAVMMMPDGTMTEDPNVYLWAQNPRGVRLSDLRGTSRSEVRIPELTDRQPLNRILTSNSSSIMFLSGMVTRTPSLNGSSRSTR